MGFSFFARPFSPFFLVRETVGRSGGAEGVRPLAVRWAGTNRGGKIIHALLLLLRGKCSKEFSLFFWDENYFPGSWAEDHLLK